MTFNGAVQDRDANRSIIATNEAIRLESTWTLAAATTGATGAHTVFTVTGNCIVQPFGICDTNLTGTGTIELGVAGNTAALIAQTTGTDLDDGDVWISATPPVGVAALPGAFIVNDGADIILTIGGSTITAGVIDFYVLYRPLSADASIVATTPA